MRYRFQWRERMQTLFSTHLHSLFYHQNKLRVNGELIKLSIILFKEYTY